MDDYESLSHSKWECKYHVVFIPKCRRKTLYAELRRHLVDVFRKLAQQKESKIEEGDLLLDHVHMLRTGHRDNTRVHQEAGRGGQAPGADESVALMSHLQVAHYDPGPRQRPRQPLRAAHNLKPPALPGDIY